MTERVHRYRTRCSWSGSTAAGYEGYDRSHDGVVVHAGDDGRAATGDSNVAALAPGSDDGRAATGDSNVAALALSSDAAFRGDPSRLNPEQLLVLAASSCQLLAFLAVAARARVDVVAYEDDAEGVMPATKGRTGLTSIVLRPRVTFGASGRVPSPERFAHLVEVAHRECFIANSLSTPVTVEPELVVAE